LLFLLLLLLLLSLLPLLPSLLLLLSNDLVIFVELYVQYRAWISMLLRNHRVDSPGDILDSHVFVEVFRVHHFERYCSRRNFSRRIACFALRFAT
jgi:hypothetical protein